MKLLKQITKTDYSTNNKVIQTRRIPFKNGSHKEIVQDMRQVNHNLSYSYFSYYCTKRASYLKHWRRKQSIFAPLSCCVVGHNSSFLTVITKAILIDQYFLLTFPQQQCCTAKLKATLTEVWKLLFKRSNFLKNDTRKNTYQGIRLFPLYIQKKVSIFPFRARLNA